MPCSDLRVQLVQTADYLDDDLRSACLEAANTHARSFYNREVGVTKRRLQWVDRMIMDRTNKVWTLQKQEVFGDIECKGELLCVTLGVLK